MMDISFNEQEMGLPQVALYSSVSFLVVSLVGVFLYITCSRKYKLNWFEKNLLETACENEALNSGQLTSSHDALLASGSIPYNVDNVDTASLRSSNRSPVSANETFWIPASHRKSIGLGIDGAAGTSADESMPCTPTSPTGSHISMALSVSSSNAVSVPIARTDKHVVLAMSPARPKVSSMQAKLDHTKIDTSLYEQAKIKRVPSIPEDTRGAINLSINYDPNAGILTVHLIEANDLQPRDFSGTADPYAKIRLLPDKTNFWQTKIHKRTLNPIFDEDFVFEEHPNVIGRRTIEILVYDFDSYSRHFCIGGTQIELESLDLSNKIDLWKFLNSYADKDAKVDLGDIMVSMSYLPSAERLTVGLVKARNLRVVDVTRNSSDPYVKVSLIQDGKKGKKRKSGVYRNTICPVFNEALTFDISKNTLKKTTIEFVVLHDSLLGSNEVLGRAIVGSAKNIPPEQRAMFDDMLRTDTSTAQWIPLMDEPSK